MVSFQTAKEMLDFISPYDYERTLQYGFSAWMERDLWHWVEHDRYFDNTYIRDLVKNGERDSRVDREKKAAMAKYFEANPELYWRFLTEKRIIDLPDLWRNEYRLTLSKAIELLTPIPPPRGIVFGLGNAYNNERYTTAIKKLQKKLDGEANAIYDEDMAEWLYIKKRHVVPKGEGYLAHEVNPDLLFSRFKPMVYGVNRLLWRMFDLDPDELIPDSFHTNSVRAGSGEEETAFGGISQGAGYAGAPFDAAERIFDNKKPVEDGLFTKELLQDAKATTNMWTKTLNGIDIAFAMGEPLLRAIQNGTVSLDTIEDVVVEGIKTGASQVGTGMAVEITLQIAFKGSPIGWGYFIAATILNLTYGIALDEILDQLADIIMDYVRTDMVDDVLHFDQWQQSFHERDLDAGIRMD